MRKKRKSYTEIIWCACEWRWWWKNVTSLGQIICFLLENRFNEVKKNDFRSENSMNFGKEWPVEHVSNEKNLIRPNWTRNKRKESILYSIYRHFRFIYFPHPIFVKKRRNRTSISFSSLYLELDSSYSSHTHTHT